MADYPLVIYTIDHRTDDVDDVMAADINTLQDEIAAIETALGTSLSNIPAAVPAATDTVSGKVELATVAEVNTGTASTVITPDTLAGSNFGKRGVQILLLNTSTPLTTDEGVGGIVFVIPWEFNGMSLVDADAAVTTPSTDGTPTIQIYNINDGHNMLSTPITIDVGAYTSFTATTQPVIDTTKDDVNAGERLRFDCSVAGTSTKGLIMMLSFQLP